MKNEYDLIIIGAGGVGLAGGMYSARLGLKTLILGHSHGSELPIGGVITTTNLVENYPGFIKLTGTEIAEKIEAHTRSYDKVTIKEELVKEIKNVSSGAGDAVWDCRNSKGKVAPGLYVYRISSQGNNVVKKLFIRR